MIDGRLEGIVLSRFRRLDVGCVGRDPEASQRPLPRTLVPLLGVPRFAVLKDRQILVAQSLEFGEQSY